MRGEGANRPNNEKALNEWRNCRGEKRKLTKESLFIREARVGLHKKVFFHTFNCSIDFKTKVSIIKLFENTFEKVYSKKLNKKIKKLSPYP